MDNDQWLQACYYVMDESCRFGARVYPFLVVLNLLRVLANLI